MKPEQELPERIELLPVSPEEEAATIVTEALRAEYVRGLRDAAAQCENLYEREKARTSSAGAGSRVAIRGCVAAITALIPVEAQPEQPHIEWSARLDDAVGYRFS